MKDIIGKRKIWYSFSAFLTLASAIALLLWGLRLGIDFTGGTLLEVEYLGERPNASEVKDKLAALDLESANVSPAGEAGYILRFKEIDDATHDSIIKSLGELVKPPEGVKREAALTELSFQSVGPVIGAELKRRSLQAIGVALLAIILYIAWAFRQVSRPIKSWKYGLIAIVALFHDIIIPAGVFAVLGKLFNVETDILFITAMLTILGFSVHDTIVVFDRVRENIKKLGRSNFDQTVNAAVNQTLARSINTSITTLLVLFSIYFFGGASTQNFALVLIIGIVSGIYSSIFIASPLLVTLYKWQEKR